MEHLPPVGWADVATKRDLDHLAVVMRSEVAQLRAELGAEFKGEIGELRTDLHKEIAGLRADMVRQMPTLFLGLAGLQVSAAAMLVGVSRVL